MHSTTMTRTALALALAAVVLGAGMASASDEVTLQGKIACAKCTLKKADAKECQNVLLVPEAGAKDAEYYIASNPVSDDFGEVCTKTTPATITGTVSERDGRKWIAPSRIERIKG